METNINKGREQSIHSFDGDFFLSGTKFIGLIRPIDESGVEKRFNDYDIATATPTEKKNTQKNKSYRTYSFFFFSQRFLRSFTSRFVLSLSVSPSLTGVIELVSAWSTLELLTYHVSHEMCYSILMREQWNQRKKQSTNKNKLTHDKWWKPINKVFRLFFYFI